MLKYIYTICCVLPLIGCESVPEAPDLTPELLNPTLDIRELQAMGDSANAIKINDEHLIGGVVTASDASGNFYRSFTIEDYTGAVEVLAGSYDLHTLYPVGRVVYVRLKGLTMGLNEQGVWQLGYAGTSARYPVGYMGGPAGLADNHVVRAGMNYEFGAAETTLAGLTDGLVGRLITIPGLTLTPPPGATWGTPGGEGDTDIPAVAYPVPPDTLARTILVRTSDYADFAAEPIPAGTADVTGILMKEKKNYLLKIRDLNDIRTP